MPAPTVTTLAASLNREPGDPLLAAAYAGALAWARVELGRTTIDPLNDLGGQNIEAVYGYARDVWRLPKSTFGYYDTDDAGTIATIGDIGRRWRSMLHHGRADRAAGFA